MQHPPIDKPRLEAVDLARGIALLAMAVYHFAWDLEFFGYADPGMTAEGFWRLFARSIASSFLFLVGVSLFLAHRHGMRWRPFARRLAMVAAAAAAISVATVIATPQTFIFFGILHQIALASLLGVAFLRVPAALTVLVAAGVVAAPFLLRHPVFDHPALWWVGLSVEIPRSNDYVPLFPWFGAVLLGLAAARLADGLGLLAYLARYRPGAWTSPLRAAGRHSLAFYLVHQPVLLSLVWLFSLAAPPAEAPVEVGFTRACVSQCTQTHGEDFCSVYCTCMLDRLDEEGRLAEVMEGRTSAETSQRLHELAEACSLDAEGFLSREDQQ